jgi:hypothetical protein
MISGNPPIIQMNAVKCQIEFTFLRIISELMITTHPEHLSFDGICTAHSCSIVQKGINYFYSV